MKHLIALADSTDRAAWLEARKPVITATQISAIVGSNPYQGIVDVWNEKTDPEWVEDRSIYLDNAAAYGVDAEARLIDYAQQELGVALTHNTVLYADADHPLDACTPDAYGVGATSSSSATALVVVDAKTASKDWISEGVPQYIIDQMLWTYHVTAADEVWLAIEHVKRNRRMEVVDILGRYVVLVPLDDGNRARLAFLVQQAAEFRQMLADGIAPESDIDIREPGFDTDPDDLAAWIAADAALTEIAQIDQRTAADVKRRAELVASLHPIVKAYAGRRVQLIGTRMTVTVGRYWQAKTDMAQIDPRAIAAATTWQEQERVTVKPNPEYVAPAAPETL